MEYVSDYEAKELICEFGRRIYARGLVGGNEGNLSVRVGKDEVWVTPTMESKGFLTPDMLIKLDLKGNILEEHGFKPSSECKVHLAIYQESERFKAVIHAHPTVATAFACTGKDIVADMLPEGGAVFGESIKIIPFAPPGTVELMENVRPYAMDNRAALLANHGALVWSTVGLKDAYFTMETLESYLRAYLTADKIIGHWEPIPEEQRAGMAEVHKMILNS